MSEPENKTPDAGDKDTFVYTYEQVSAELHAKNGISVDKHDPVLCVVTINNLYFEKLNRLMERHAKAMKGYMSETTKDMTQDLEKEIRIFAKAAKKMSIDNAMAGIVVHQKSMDAFLVEMRALATTTKVFCGMAIGASAFLLLVMIFSLVRGEM
ncbi:MAG: hypothetical protein LBL79_06010 [Prevotella sp.]|jgi:hypothetical protein|nr:hypothetical protein [Prevotella sp.]